jgi:hypothetical protein
MTSSTRSNRSTISPKLLASRARTRSRVLDRHNPVLARVTDMNSDHVVFCLPRPTQRLVIGIDTRSVHLQVVVVRGENVPRVMVRFDVLSCLLEEREFHVEVNGFCGLLLLTLGTTHEANVQT